MVNEFKAVLELKKKTTNIIEEIEKVSKEYDADTFPTGMTFLHILFDNFVDSQKLDREEVYKKFAFEGIKTAREAKELLDISSELS